MTDQTTKTSKTEKNKISNHGNKQTPSDATTQPKKDKRSIINHPEDQNTG